MLDWRSYFLESVLGKKAIWDCGKQKYGEKKNGNERSYRSFKL